MLRIEAIDFWMHRIFVEKYLVKWLCKRKRYSSYTTDQIRIKLNKSRIYRIVSWIFTKLSVPHVFPINVSADKMKNRWGYCFIVALKCDDNDIGF